jgi:hypothetical protein
MAGKTADVVTPGDVLDDGDWFGENRRRRFRSRWGRRAALVSHEVAEAAP